MVTHLLSVQIDIEVSEATYVERGTTDVPSRLEFAHEDGHCVFAHLAIPQDFLGKRRMNQRCDHRIGFLHADPSGGIEHPDISLCTEAKEQRQQSDEKMKLCGDDFFHIFQRLKILQKK